MLGGCAVLSLNPQFMNGFALHSSLSIACTILEGYHSRAQSGYSYTCGLYTSAPDRSIATIANRYWSSDPKVYYVSPASAEAIHLLHEEY